MAKSRDLELALRIRADLDQAVKDLRLVEGGLTAIGSAGKKASDGLSKIDAGQLQDAANAADAAADSIGKTGDAAADASKGIEQTGESAEQAAQRLRDMVQASLENQRATSARVAAELAAADAARVNTQASADRADEIERANQAAYASQAATTAQIQSIGELSERIERGASSFQDLADTEALIDQQMQAGLLTQQEQLQMFEALDKQEKQLTATHEREEKQVQALLRAYDPASAALSKLAQDEAKLKAAVDAGRISREQYNRAMVGITASRAQWEEVRDRVEATSQSLFGLNVRAGQVRQSLASIARNLASGNLSGAGSSLLTLGAHAAAGFSTLGLAIGGVVGALALFAVAAFKGYREGQELNRVLLESGEASGVTASGFYGMAQAIDDSVGHVGQGRAALLALVSTGEASAQTLQQAGLAAVQLAELTGRSIQDTARQIKGVLDDPARGIAELNQQYHFLTAATYEQVAALQQQGSTTEAAQLALEQFTQVHAERIKEAKAQLGLFERKWIEVRDLFALGLKVAKDVDRDLTPLEELDGVRFALDELNTTIEAITRDGREGLSRVVRGELEELERRRDAMQTRLDELQLKFGVEQERQNAVAADQRKQDEGIAALRRQEAQFQDRAITKEAELLKLTKDVAAARASGLTQTSGGLPLDDFEQRRRKEIETKFKEPATKQTDADRDAKAREQFVAQLEHQAAVIGLTKQQTVEYEIAEKKLTGTLQERAKAAAQAIAASEGNEAAKRDAQQLAEIQTQYLRAIGQSSQAAQQELEHRYDELLARLIARGDKAGEDIVRKLFSADKARNALTELQTEFDRFNQDISREEQRVNIARENGLISSVEAQRRLLDLRQEEIKGLEQLIPKLEASNALIGDPAITARIEDMKLKLFELQNQAGLLETAFRNGFEGGLGDALAGLADGTLTLREALTGLLQDVARGLAQVAAQQLASIATAQLMKAITGKSGTAPGLQAPDPVQAAAAGAAYALPIVGAATALTASGGILVTAAAALSAAATQLAVANSLSAFAEGGYTGPGGKYEFGGIVHRDEYVQPKVRMREPGALPFMENFRRMGMAAIDRWRGYAGGGLVTSSPSTSMQSRHVTAPSGGTSSERSSSSMLLGLSDGLVVKDMKTSAGVEAMIHNIARNPGQFRSAMGF